MKTKLILPFLSICALLFMGCPYESQVPISRNFKNVNTAFLGVWQSREEVYHTYEILKASDYSYRVIQRNTLDEEKLFTGYISEVKGGALFLNLYTEQDDLYYLYRIQVDAPKQITLVPVNPNIKEQFRNTDALKEFVEKNVNFQSFYDDDEKLTYKQIQAP